MPPKEPQKRSEVTAGLCTPNLKCTTLLEDEMTRCSETPTHGNPVERCRVHHEQYCTMTKRYKEAQKFIDETFDGALIPTKDDVAGYTTVAVVLEKARMMKKYVNAIREERTGRDIHHQRFFLKVDVGHQVRIKVLAKRMEEGVEIRDALEARAMEIHIRDHPAKDWIKQFQHAPLEDDDNGESQVDEDLLSRLRIRHEKLQQKYAVNETDDLIGLQIRHEREQRLQFLEAILDPMKAPSPLFKQDSESANNQNFNKLLTSAFAQYTRRIVFHDPILYVKSMDKVSMKDLVMDDDFGPDDMLRFSTLWEKRSGIGLKWWKDSWTEAIAMKGDPNASAKMGNPSNRVFILGGWVYNNSRRQPASNAVWYRLLTADPPAKDNESRYVKLCCNFDKLHSFMVFNALLSSTAPSFCSSPDPRAKIPNSIATRGHLSLCGVVLTDLVGSARTGRPGPVRTSLPAKTRGYVTWVEREIRAYMFGAIRNEPDDFTAAFLRELRARPDLFSVITRSETDPPRKLESFGTVTDQMRTRKFEGPPGNPPRGQGSWEVLRSAEHVLYGGDHSSMLNDMPKGYLSPAFGVRKVKGWRKAFSFFSYKRFSVKYFLILSASPTQGSHDLARQVSWAAFKSHGLVHGNYDEARYTKASEVLFAKQARERLSFLPEGSFSVNQMVK